jgi:L-ascorbate metabolism protein UlaG (beta-lactamase superfamily)
MSARMTSVALAVALALACSRSQAPEPSPTPPAPAPAAGAPAQPRAAAPDAAAARAAPPGPQVTDTLETSAGALRIIPIHHGTLALELGETTIVVDPWSKAPGGWLPKADLVLLTDHHPDHLDPAAIQAVRKEGTVFVAPKVVVDKLPEAKPLANGQEITELGIKIRAVPMYNLKRGPEPGKLYHDKGRGNGYVLEIGDKLVYLSGDTECTPEMRALKKIDLAFVSMNLPYTMPPEEAAECVKAFAPKIVIPYHYRGSDLALFSGALSDVKGVEVRIREFYSQGQKD